MLRPKEFNWHAYWLTTWSTMKPIIYKSKIATICTLQSPNQTQRCKICYVACTHPSSWIGFSRWKVAWRHENKRTPTGTNWTIPFMTLHGRYGDTNFIFMAHDELWRSTGCASGFFFLGGNNFWSVVTTCHYQTLGDFHPVRGEICNFCSFLNNSGTNVLIIFGGESPKNFSEILSGTTFRSEVPPELPGMAGLCFDAEDRLEEAPSLVRCKSQSMSQ